MSDKRYDSNASSNVQPGPAERLRALEAENASLKREVAMLTVDKLILEEVAAEYGRAGARKYSVGG